MYELRVGDNIYKIKFGYGVLYKTDLIDRVLAASIGNEEKPAESLRNLIGLTSELLLAGLQKKHKDEFGWETESEREQMILKVCDLIDDYEDEHTDADGKRDKSGFTLFTELQAELEKNGFLSMITTEAQQTAADQNATVVPMDHIQKKAGKSK